MEPLWLDLATLEQLQAQYPRPPEYRYDPAALVERGEKKATELLHLTHGGRAEIRSYLELGAWDGMVGYALRRRGKNVTCIDDRSVGFDERAFRAGVELLQMDAADLGFEKESFDVVFSYDAMEHFSEPGAVLSEAIRVTKPGGYIYLYFGPLYDSPMGLHAYNSITVPYCQFLFPRDMLLDFCRTHELGVIDFDQLNGWSLETYRRLWEQHAHRLRPLIYREGKRYSDLDLIERYPDCFRSKTSSFASLTVGHIEVLFRKVR